MSSTILALEILYRELAFLTRHSTDEGREYLNDLEIEYLIKMTNDIVMKNKLQTKEISL